MERALAAWNYLRAVSHRADRRISPPSRPADGCDGSRRYLCLSGPHVQWSVVARGPRAPPPGGRRGRGRSEGDLEIVRHRAGGLPDDVPARPGERAGQPRIEPAPGGLLCAPGQAITTPLPLEGTKEDLILSRVSLL